MLNRRAFTLTELLVVIVLIMILAALAITFFPTASSAAREARAAIAVQSWLTVAKQRALRDQSPRGVRLHVTSITVNNVILNQVVTDANFIEQADDFAAGTIESAVPTPPPAAALGYTSLNTVLLPTADLTNGQANVIIPNGNDPNVKFWTVQPGDRIEFNGGGLMHTIIQIGVPDANGAIDRRFVQFRPPVMFTIGKTKNYRIMRASRLAGDDPLKMEADAIIDLGTNLTYSKSLPQPASFDLVAGKATFRDILFAPNGQVISPGLSDANVHLWVRVPNPEQPADIFAGDPTIVSVFVRTGLAGAFPVDPVTAGNPYTLVK